MTWLIVLGIVIAVLIGIGLLRGGACAEYSDAGLSLTVLFGPIHLSLLPPKVGKKKKQKEEKPRKKSLNIKKTKKNSQHSKGKKGGSLQKILTILPTALDAFGRFFRLLSIDEITVHYCISGDDPYKIAMQYGTIGGSLGILGPTLLNTLHVKKWDVSFEPCFLGIPDTVYLKARATIAVWQVIYLVLKLDFKAIVSVIL